MNKTLKVLHSVLFNLYLKLIYVSTKGEVILTLNTQIHQCKNSSFKNKE